MAVNQLMDDFIEHFSYLAASPADRERLGAIASCIRAVERDGDELRAVLRQAAEGWFLFHALAPSDSAAQGHVDHRELMVRHADARLFSCYGANDVAGAMAATPGHDATCGVSFQLTSWCEPIDWLHMLAEQHAVDPEEVAQVAFLLGCELGCFYSTGDRAERRMVFVDRDAPEPGLHSLFAKPDVLDHGDGRPELRALTHQPLGSIFLRLAHDFVLGHRLKTYRVVLLSAGAQKLRLVKGLASILGLGLKDAKLLADHLPSTLKADLESVEAAMSLKEAVEGLGGAVALSKVEQSR